jgi:hypothetical protein
MIDVRTRWPPLCLAAAVLLALPAPAGGSSDAPLELKDEIRRVAAHLERLLPADQRAAVASRLERAAAAAKAGRAYLALYELESPWEMVGAHTFSRRVATTGSREFAEQWRAAGEPAARPERIGTGRVPLVVEALASAAAARGPALYHASLSYAEDAGLDAGLYYLGESQAVGAFAARARSLPWRPAGDPPTLRSLTPELDALDAEVSAAYREMEAAEHQDYMHTSVALKRARALNEQGLYAGALLEYLQARYRFAALRRASAAAGDHGARLAAARRRLPGPADHSIGLLFVELAEAAQEDTGSGDRGAAAAVVNDVLPAYEAAIRAGPVPAAPPAPAVTITLVRWPFT